MAKLSLAELEWSDRRQRTGYGCVAEGGVWITNSGRALPQQPGSRGGVTHVDPATQKITSPPLNVGKRPSAIALGEGGLWVTNEDSGTLTPITTARQR